MKSRRLIKCVDIVRLWPFFVQGFAFVGRYRKYSLNITSYGQMLRKMVKTQNAWVAVTEDEDGTPLAFWCAQEITPTYAEEREFEVFLRFHLHHHLEATHHLKDLFEKFCKEESVKRYFISTRRDDSVGPRRSLAFEYGMKKAYTVFKKEL